MASVNHWLWLTTRIEAGKKLNALLDAFLSCEHVYQAEKADYLRVPDLGREDVEKLCDKSLDGAEAIRADCAKKNISIVTYQDSAYPEMLRMIYDPPGVLYVVGRLPDFDERVAVGMVGTRRASVYGLNVAGKLGYRLSMAGVLVVSGMASGIDGECARGALRAGKATVAVLGCGADVCYPAENRDIFTDIPRLGAIVSEYPPGTRPAPGYFPRRNRLISGLSDGVVVVEAPAKSGALITARLALKQGRDVFAVPGNIDTDAFVGTNTLIASGEARAVVSVKDILEEYALRYPNKIDLTDAEYPLMYPNRPAREKSAAAAPKAPAQAPVKERSAASPSVGGGNGLPEDLDELERRLASLLADGERHIDELITAAGAPSGEVLLRMTMLELKGIVRQLPGKRFVRKSD